MAEENFDHFEQQAIMDGSSSPAEIIAEREAELKEDEKIEEAENTAVQDYYSDNKEEIIKEFREETPKDELPENDEDLENWYKDELMEIAKDWYEDL